MVGVGVGVAVAVVVGVGVGVVVGVAVGVAVAVVVGVGVGGGVGVVKEGDAMQDLVFPQPVEASLEQDGKVFVGLTSRGGLSKRELFAAMAMQGILAQRHADLLAPKEVAARAYTVAAALMTELGI